MSGGGRQLVTTHSFASGHRRIPNRNRTLPCTWKMIPIEGDSDAGDFRRRPTQKKRGRRRFDDDLDRGKEGSDSWDHDRNRQANRGRNYRQRESLEFRCRQCSHMIGPPPGGGRQRNHCPLCLHSLHLDRTPGDRAADCGSLMEPIAIWVRSEEWVLLHRCRGCGEIRPNRIAADDNEALLISLAVRGIGRPAFPLYHPWEVDS